MHKYPVSGSSRRQSPLSRRLSHVTADFLFRCRFRPQSGHFLPKRSYCSPLFVNASKPSNHSGAVGEVEAQAREEGCLDWEREFPSKEKREREFFSRSLFG